MRVGFVSSAALDMIPPLAVAFRKSHPEVDLDLIDLQTSVQLEGLCSNSLDVGFLRMPADHHLLALTVVHREHFVMVLPKTHVLAKKSRVNLGDLRKDKFVAYGRRWAPGFFDSIMGMCHKVGFSPDIVQETAEMFTASALVGAELGVAIMPRSVVLAQTAGVVFKLIPKSVGVSEIAVATAKGNASPLVRSFVRFTSRFQKLAL